LFGDLPFLLKGLTITLQVVAGGVAVALMAAMVSGLAVRSHLRWLRWPARIYIEVFRGSSALVQLYWVFYVLPLLLGIKLGAMLVGVLVLGLNIGAYGAEVVRGALNGVSRGQHEAAIALGLSPAQRMWRIILPQAVPAMIPTFGNLIIELLKVSTAVMFITLHDVMWSTMILRGRHPERSLMIFIEVMVIFGLCAALLAALVRLLERRSVRRALGRGVIAVGDGLCAAIRKPAQWIAWPFRKLADGTVGPRVGTHALGLIMIGIALVLLLLRMNRQWDWIFTVEVVLPAFAKAIWVTVLATIQGASLALILGLVWASLRRVTFVGTLVFGLLESIRSTPLLVQLFMVYYGILPAMNWQVDPFVVGSVLLGIHYSCYTAEVYRAGIDSVPAGQWEAARALGFSPWQSLVRVIIPQAVPRAVPALGNYVVAMFKETPWLSTITVIELLGVAEEIQADHFRGLEAFTLVGVTFLVLSLISTAMIRQVERGLPVRHA